MRAELMPESSELIERPQEFKIGDPAVAKCSDEIAIGTFYEFKANPVVVLISGCREEFAKLAIQLARLSDDYRSINDRIVVKPSNVERNGATQITLKLDVEERLVRVDTGWLWCLTRETIREVGEKVEELSLANHGHQYFDGCSSSDIVVMMSVGEYDTMWWSGATL